MNSSHDGTSGTKSPKPQTSHLEGFEWEVILVKDDDPSALCAPGGKIAVFTGLLEQFTDAEIAFGIAHEVCRFNIFYIINTNEFYVCGFPVHIL